MSRETLFRRRKRRWEAAVLALIHAAAALSVILLLGIAGYVFYRGGGMLRPGFFTAVTSELKGTVGIAGNLVNTLYIIVITLLVATPVGVGAAIYLNEYARPGRLAGLMEFATQTLAGIPSVIFGLFGYVFFGGVMGLGYSLLNGALTLSLMVLPLIVQNTREALRAVPDSYKNGALGMWSTKWYMIRTVLLPSAAPGILSGVILAVGRIVGESAALLLTAGSARALPKLGRNMLKNADRLFSKIFRSGGTLTVELYLQMQDGGYEAAFGIGCVLIAIVLVVNFTLKLIAGRLFRRR